MTARLLVAAATDFTVIPINIFNLSRSARSTLPRSMSGLGVGPPRGGALYSKKLMPSRPRLLIVESDESVRRVLGRVLSNRFEITPIASGKSALGRLREAEYEVMLLDLALTDMPALDLMRAARELAPTLPLIVTTPAHDAATEASVMTLGALAYLAKPFNTPDLQAPLERALAAALVR